mmetsp:Transcript_34589/g.58694  ORF Transcript_34589/g.58694 Transcript_34589/m.58694 type:complete len:113 (+) Transcript_34589:405-743(+)
MIMKLAWLIHKLKQQTEEMTNVAEQTINKRKRNNNLTDFKSAHCPPSYSSSYSNYSTPPRSLAPFSNLRAYPCHISLQGSLPPLGREGCWLDITSRIGHIMFSFALSFLENG